MAGVDGGFIRGVENAKIIKLVRGDVAPRQHFRPAEEVALEVGESPCIATAEILMRFYFFSYQANVSRQKCARHAELFVIRTGHQVHFNEIGEIHERRPGRAVLEMVQREKKAA